MCFNPEFEEISGDSRAKPSLSDLNQGESGVCLQVQGFLYGRPEVTAVHAKTSVSETARVTPVLKCTSAA